MVQIDMDKIFVSPFNIRKRRGLLDVTELAESMKALGLIQPVVVRKKNGKYELIVGQRRYLAAKQLGWEKIDAVVRELSDKDALAISIKENKDREDIDPFDYAHAVKRFRDEFCETDKEAYERLGMSEGHYYRWLDLLGLEPILKRVEEKKPEKLSHGRVTERGLRDYTPFKRIYEDEPEKLEELIEETIDLKPEERKRVINHIKAFPEKDIKEVKEKVLKMPGPITLHIQFSARVARGLEKAAEDRMAGREDIVKIAVEDWLTENKYLED
jgi:ParB family chromosome partitioning protein